MNSDLWHKFIDNQSAGDIDHKRKRLVLTFASYIGGVVILLFAFRSLTNANVVVSSILALSGFVILSNVIFSHFRQNIQLFCNIGSIAISFMIISLAASGGHENTALYWLFPFPLIIFVLLGYNLGLWVNIITFIVVLIVILKPELNIATYRQAEITRFMASYLVTIVLSFIAELFRFQSQENLRLIHNESKKEANTDQLTKLPNRRFYHGVLMNKFADFPSDNFPLAMVITDVDHFKQVNDVHGHKVGDDVLVFLAGLLKGNMRETDFAIRVGGEEFLLLFPKASLDIGVSITEKLRNKIAHSPFVLADGNELNITMSFGVSVAQTPAELDKMYVKADKLLYQSKNNGRNLTSYEET